MYIQYPGDLFLRMLKCLIVPLIVSSITSAIGALDLSLSKKIAFRYLSTRANRFEMMKLIYNPPSTTFQINHLLLYNDSLCCYPGHHFSNRHSAW